MKCKRKNHLVSFSIFSYNFSNIMYCDICRKYFIKFFKQIVEEDVFKSLIETDFLDIRKNNRTDDIDHKDYFK